MVAPFVHLVVLVVVGMMLLHLDFGPFAGPVLGILARVGVLRVQLFFALRVDGVPWVGRLRIVCIVLVACVVATLVKLLGLVGRSKLVLGVGLMVLVPLVVVGTGGVVRVLVRRPVGWVSEALLVLVGAGLFHFTSSFELDSFSQNYIN